MKLFRSLGLLFIFLLGSILPTYAMTSSNYVIDWDNVNIGGTEGSTSTSYVLNDTIGQVVTGTSTSASYGLSAGYRAEADPLSLSMVVRGQSTNASSTYSGVIVTASGSDYIGSVDVLSPGTFEVDDYIAVVQNVGFSGVVAIGKVTQKVGNQLTVDRWDGQPASLSASPAGDDDFVYKLGSTSSIPFGTLAVGQQNIALAGVSVNSSALGYTAYYKPDGTLRTADGLSSITYCEDGEVSTDAEEYGVAIRGRWSPYTTPAQDADIRESVILGNDYESRSPVDNSPDRLAMLFKINILSSTTPGSYSQNLYFTLTPNF